MALAHTVDFHIRGLFAGIEHPLFGFDHLLAMVAVGIIAAGIGGRGIFLVPLSFVSAMVAGAFLGMAGICLPSLEHRAVAGRVRRHGQPRTTFDAGRRRDANGLVRIVSRQRPWHARDRRVVRPQAHPLASNGSHRRYRRLAAWDGHGITSHLIRRYTIGSKDGEA
jgi:HupE / UreJ protein